MSMIEEISTAVGVEIVIFVITIAFAAALRMTSSKQMGKTIRKKDLSELQPTKKVCSVPTQQAKGSRGTLKKKQPSELIESIFSIMRDHPSQRSANQAVQYYSELRGSIECVADMDAMPGRVSIADVMQSTKHSAIEFYTLVVQCAVRSGQCHLVTSIIDDMKKAGVSRPFVFYESTMKQLAGQKQHHIALSVYDRMNEDGLEPSAITCSCLINFATEVGDTERALRFFEKLSSITTPSIRAYMTMLRALGKQHDWPRSLAVLRDMQDRQVAVDSLVLNVILSTGVAADKLLEVKELLAEAAATSPPTADVVSYNTVIKGYAQRGESREALLTVKMMQARNVAPNAITFNTVLDSAVRSSDSTQVWDILKQMRSCGIRPDRFTCSIFVKGITKQPTSDKILTGLEMLAESGGGCDTALQTSLYNAILEATTAIPDNALAIKTVTQMRQRHIAINEASKRRILDSSA